MHALFISPTLTSTSRPPVTAQSQHSLPKTPTLALPRTAPHGPSNHHCASSTDSFRKLDPGREPPPRPLDCCSCPLCRRRPLLIASLSPLLLLPELPSPPSTATMIDALASPTVMKKKVVRPSRPGWYEELYAKALEQGMRSYEAEIAGYKTALFTNLRGENKKVLELGVGTGPNLKYYANAAGFDVFGVDPNKQMEKYAQAAAVSAGLPLTHFTFIQGVGEDLPLADDSMDAVIGTLVLCSVQDVNATIREVKRVLKPGGLYIFIEHVAAADGSLLRLLQTAVDPLQQWVADGCHLTRETGKYISDAGFSDVRINTTSLSTVSIIAPHVYGIACK